MMNWYNGPKLWSGQAELYAAWIGAQGRGTGRGGIKPAFTMESGRTQTANDTKSPLRLNEGDFPMARGGR